MTTKLTPTDFRKRMAELRAKDPAPKQPLTDEQLEASGARKSTSVDGVTFGLGKGSRRR